ncbi:MAG: class I SAM-dependent methyltransferase [Caldilineaceae bacterium]
MSASEPSAAINRVTAPFLLSTDGRAALAELQQHDLSEQLTMTRLQDLRREFSPAEAGALLTQARLRQKAVGKFPNAEQLFFTPDALEQATAWPVAQHRAAWFAERVPAGPILDLGCGIGGDLLALAEQRPVIGIDLDPVRLQFAAANAEIMGVADRVQLIEADWTSLRRAGTLPHAVAAFADPARRRGSKRIFRLHQIQPLFRNCWHYNSKFQPWV